MNAGETTPPPLPTSSRVCWPGSNLRSLGFLLGLMVVARVAMHYQLPLPGCPMRELSGVPCPFCGSTRAFAALAGFDLLAALKLNPLVTLAALVAGVAWMVSAIIGKERVDRVRIRLLASAVSKWLLALLLVLNWFYVWRNLPR